MRYNKPMKRNYTSRQVAQFERFVKAHAMRFNNMAEYYGAIYQYYYGWIMYKIERRKFMGIYYVVLLNGEMVFHSPNWFTCMRYTLEHPVWSTLTCFW